MNFDFSYDKAEDRISYINSKIEDGIPFNLEDAADYILRGEGGAIERSNTWKLAERSRKEIASYEALTELGWEPNSSVPIAKPSSHVFDREKARKTATPEALESLEPLWAQIDSLKAKGLTPRHKTLHSLYSQQYDIKDSYTNFHTLRNSELVQESPTLDLRAVPNPMEYPAAMRN